MTRRGRSEPWDWPPIIEGRIRLERVMLEHRRSVLAGHVVAGGFIVT